MSVTRLDVPIGTILDYAGSSVPSGYLECDGSAVSRTTYAKLFAAIGTAWGTGDGSTTFNLPDFRGRMSIGAGTGTAGGASAHALASKGGDERYQQHSHTVTSSGGSTSGTPSNNTSGGSNVNTSGPSNNTSGAGSSHSHTVAIGSHSHFASNAVSGGKHTTRFLEYNYAKTSAGVSERSVASASGNYKAPVVNHASVDWAGNDDTAPTDLGTKTSSGESVHTHSLSNHTHTLNNHTHTLSSHTHTTPNHTHTIDNSGSGSAGNMPPFATVKKIIRAS